jgi:hypothetical protein
MTENTLEKIEPIVKDKNLTPGVAYVVFNCGCILLQDEYNAEKRVFKTKNDKVRTVCPSHPFFENRYLGRYRICARCGFEDAARKGRGFETNVCKTCNSSEWDLAKIESRKTGDKDIGKIIESVRASAPIKRKTRTKYYQDGKKIKPPKNPETNALCAYRDHCLDAMKHESDSFLHCTGCKNFKNWIDMY